LFFLALFLFVVIMSNYRLYLAKDFSF